MATTDDTRAEAAQPASELTVESILAAVEEQRSLLINVLGVVQCVQGACHDGERPVELEGALGLVEDEIMRILEGLEGPSLEKAAATAELQP